MVPTGDLEETVARCLEAAGLGPRDTVLVAVSGGGDSVALLRLLVAQPEERRPRLAVAHYRHGDRPGVDEDAAFVRQLAGAWGLPFLLGRLPEEARRRPLSEDGLRRYRHRFLEEAAGAVGARAIALGHTLDDQAETVVLRLLRGTGTDGLVAMRPVGPGRRLRPLLGVSRQALRAYLQAIGQDFREDPTNADLAAERNRVRHQVMPLLEAVRPGATRHLARLAEAAADARELADLALEGLLPVRVRDGPVGPWCHANAARWRAAPPAVRRAWLRRAAAAVGAPWPPHEWTTAWAELPAARPRPHWPPVVVGWEAGRDEGVVLARAVDLPNLRLPVPGAAPWPPGGWLAVRRDPAPGFDAVSLPEEPEVLEVRGWRPGDRLADGRSATRLMRGRGVPPRLRSRLPVAVDGTGTVVWVPGWGAPGTPEASRKIWVSWGEGRPS